MLPEAVHELATFATLMAASGWLVAHLVRISRPRTHVGCARCEHNVAAGAQPSTGVRSKRLRVLGQAR